jgi:hypothetical protein
MGAECESRWLRTASLWVFIFFVLKNKSKPSGSQLFWCFGQATFLVCILYYIDAKDDAPARATFFNAFTTPSTCKTTRQHALLLLYFNSLFLLLQRRGRRRASTRYILACRLRRRKRRRGGGRGEPQQAQRAHAVQVPCGCRRRNGGGEGGGGVGGGGHVPSANETVSDGIYGRNEY